MRRYQQWLLQALQRIMENSIQLLSAGMSEWNMAENTAGISKKSTHPCRKKGRTDLCPD